MARQNKAPATGKRRTAAQQTAPETPRVEAIEGAVEAPPPEEAVMQESKTQQDMMQPVNQATSRAIDAATLWAEANQRVLTQLVEFGTGAAKESVRLYAELQQSALDAWRESQSATLRWQSSWQDAPKDPAAWYQKTLTDGVDGAQKWFRMLEGNAQAMTKSAERMQATAEQTGKGIQQTFNDVVGRVKDVYSKN
jgi:hypothetical protein